MSAIDCLILCGGFGTRLQDTVPNLPKVLAPVQGKAFIDWLIDYYHAQGLSRFILCAGYRSDDLKSHFSAPNYRHLDIVFSEEATPLGTGGAIWHAIPHIRSPQFLVLNGDTFCALSVSKCVDTIITKEALILMAIVSQKNASRYGALLVGDHDEILSFDEKSTVKKSGMINAGSYLISQTLFDHYTPSQSSFSLEKDTFPFLCQKRQGVYGTVVSEDTFIDMGTAQSYEEANATFRFPL